jgi:hypothetical protein
MLVSFNPCFFKKIQDNNMIVIELYMDQIRSYCPKPLYNVKGAIELLMHGLPQT